MTTQKRFTRNCMCMGWTEQNGMNTDPTELAILLKFLSNQLFSEIL